MTVAPVNENVLVNEKANKRILYVLVLTLIITVMNGTVFNVALPTIISDLGLSMLQGSWIGTAYLTIFAVGTLTYGKLTEKFKLSTLITFGLRDAMHRIDYWSCYSKLHFADREPAHSGGRFLCYAYNGSANTLSFVPCKKTWSGVRSRCCRYGVRRFIGCACFRRHHDVFGMAVAVRAAAYRALCIARVSS